MSAESILLPGDVPGLLRRGAPVVGVGENTGVGRGVVVYIAPEGPDRRHPIVAWEGGSRFAEYNDEVALDLRDEAGVDRALRWLAGALNRMGTISPPTWAHVRNLDGAICGWNLDHPRWGCDVTFIVPVGSFSKAYGPIVPALASIPLDSPDADLLALAAVCLHVAGRAA